MTGCKRSPDHLPSVLGGRLARTSLQFSLPPFPHSHIIFSSLYCSRKPAIAKDWLRKIAFAARCKQSFPIGICVHPLFPPLRANGCRGLYCSDCVTLVRPVADEAQLQSMYTLPYNQLRPEFRSQMETLQQKVHASAHSNPKRIAGAVVNGSAFVRLAQCYVEALNTGAMPTIQSAWQSVGSAAAPEPPFPSFLPSLMSCYWFGVSLGRGGAIA
jgi:hypothetical protein